jgi:maltoporin
MPETITPITTYEGATNYNDYLTWKKSNDQYNLYQKEGERLVNEGSYANPVNFTADKFKSMYGMQDFNLPEGATGFTRYEVNKEGVNPQVNGNFYSDPSGQNMYKIIKLLVLSERFTMTHNLIPIK